MGLHAWLHAWGCMPPEWGRMGQRRMLQGRMGPARHCMGLHRAICHACSSTHATIRLSLRSLTGVAGR